MKVTIILMGDDIELDIAEGSTWDAIRQMVLAANYRPSSEFDVRDMDGNRLNPTSLVSPGTYYISPMAGFGASHINHRRVKRPDRWRSNKSTRWVICANSFRLDRVFRSRGVRRTLRQTLPLEITGEPPRQVKSNSHLRRCYWGGFR